MNVLTNVYIGLDWSPKIINIDLVNICQQNMVLSCIYIMWNKLTCF